MARGTIAPCEFRGRATGRRLPGAAKNEQEDADYMNETGASKHKPALPLFDASDVSQALKLLRPTQRDTWFSPAEPIWTRYHDVGHLLGAAMIELEIRTPQQPLR